MAGEAVFRTEETKEPVEAVETEAVKPDIQIDTKSTVETPVALFQSIEGRPYTADYFEVKEIWNNRDLGMKDELESIEKYYIRKVQTHQIEDGRKSFDRFIKEMQKAIGVTEMTPRQVRISKLSEYVKFMLRVEKIDKEKW